MKWLARERLKNAQESLTGGAAGWIGVNSSISDGFWRRKEGLPRRIEGRDLAIDGESKERKKVSAGPRDEQQSHLFFRCRNLTTSIFILTQSTRPLPLPEFNPHCA